MEGRSVDSSVARVGGLCGFAAGLLTLVAAVLYLLLPPEQRAAVGGAELLPSVAAGAGILRLEFIVLALVGIFGIGLVPALARLVEDANAGLVRWMATLATVGYAITSASYFFTLARLPAVAAAYAEGDESTRAALLGVWRSSLDLQGYWQFVAVGGFVVVVSWYAARLGRLPNALAAVGVAMGALSILATVASGARAPSFLTAVVGVGGVVIAPVWYVWTGAQLWRRADAG